MALESTVSISGQVISPSGYQNSLFGPSFLVFDFTNSMTVLQPEALFPTPFLQNEVVQVSGSLSLGHRQNILNATDITRVTPPNALVPSIYSTTVFNPSAIGETYQVCNCSNVISYTFGQYLTVRGKVIEFGIDLPWGWYVHLEGIENSGEKGKIFIDAESAVNVELLQEEGIMDLGQDVCISGVVSIYKAEGYELMPMNNDAFRKASNDPADPDPCGLFTTSSASYDTDTPSTSRGDYSSAGSDYSQRKEERNERKKRGKKKRKKRKSYGG